MTQYMERGSSLYLGNELDMIVHKTLPLGTYVVNFDRDRACYFLSRTVNFTNPKKLYGGTQLRASRFLQTFSDRPSTTGVLLAGSKGSGKSLEMREAAIQAYARGISTLIVSAPYFGEGFNAFISSIQEPALVLFDEFEKVYDPTQQEQLLTLLDGTIQTKKLVIMTCNDKTKINHHMINRPGRLFYYLKYTGVTQEFIIEYCEDNLEKSQQKIKIPKICSLASLFSEFNFDMLKALVEELNRYKESVKEAVHILNIEPDNFRQSYDVKIQRMSDGVFLETKEYYPNTVYSPVACDEINVEFYAKFGKNEDDEDIVIQDSKDIDFIVHNDTTRVKSDLSEIKFDNGEYRVICTKAYRQSFDYTSLY